MVKKKRWVVHFLLIALVIVMSVQVCFAETAYSNRIVIQYITLSSQTTDVNADSITVTIGDTSKTVQAVFNRQKKLNDSSYDSSSYSCAGLVTKFYSTVFGVSVYNLKGPTYAPKVQNNAGSFTQVTDNPRIGDIVRFNNTTHWAIVKSYNASTNRARIIQQNAWYVYQNEKYTRAEIADVQKGNSNVSFFRFTKPAWSNFTQVAALSTTGTISNGGSSIRIRNYPYGDSLCVGTLSSGAKVQLKRSVSNSFGAIWYELSTGGFVPAGNVTGVDTESPVISNIAITNITSDGYTVSCDVTDNVGVTKVAFPTWTLAEDENGDPQDDLDKGNWPVSTAVTVNSGANETKTVSYTVRITDHNNESGIYRTHIYAYDAAGNKVNATQTLNPVLDVNVPPPFCSLAIGFYLNGNPAPDSIACGSCDLYIDGSLDRTYEGTTLQIEEPGYSFSIQNIQAREGYEYIGASDELSAASVQEYYKEIKLYFVTTIGGEWQEVYELPENYDPEMYDIEYRYREEYTGRTSPGDEWTLYEEGEVQYEKDGEPYKSTTPKATSDTRELLGHYYFHWCGDPNNAQNANYYEKSYLKTYHEVPMSDTGKFTITQNGTDGDGSGRKVYKLVWKEGQWAGGVATCVGGSGTYYEGDVYQDYKPYQINTWIRDSEWTDTEDPDQTPTAYRLRRKPYQITFDPNGGETELGIMEKYHGIDLLVPEEIPVRSGFTFDGWTCDLEGNEQKYFPNDVIALNQEITLYAQWTAISIMKLPTGLTIIEEEAFANCGALIIQIPEGCTTIEANAFSNNPNLLEIHIPSSVTQIDFEAFENCPKLTIYAPENSRAAKLANTLHIPYEAE